MMKAALRLPPGCQCLLSRRIFARKKPLMDIWQKAEIQEQAAVCGGDQRIHCGWTWREVLQSMATIAEERREEITRKTQRMETSLASTIPPIRHHRMLALSGCARAIGLYTSY